MTLHYEIRDGVGLIVLDRPQVKNAFTFEMIDRWAEVLREAARDEAVGALVLTGADGAFCSGVDLAALRTIEDTPLAHKQMLTDRIHQVLLAIEDLGKPIIAAIDGAAVGAGLDMALACDIRLASTRARMSEGYIKVGLIPGDGGAWFLPRVVGHARAVQMLLTGETVDAAEALSMGLVTGVHDPDDLLDAALTLAGRLASGPPVQRAMIMRAIRHGRTSDLRSHLDLISSHMGVVMATEDFREAGAALREKRRPQFEGR